MPIQQLKHSCSETCYILDIIYHVTCMDTHTHTFCCTHQIRGYNLEYNIPGHYIPFQQYPVLSPFHSIAFTISSRLSLVENILDPFTVSPVTDIYIYIHPILLANPGQIFLIHARLGKYLQTKTMHRFRRDARAIRREHAERVKQQEEEQRRKARTS